MRNVAVLEKGWLGGGNTGRNTTIVRSNYHLDPNAHFYELLAASCGSGCRSELNFNVMYSARGVLNLVHSPADMDAAMRRGNAMRLNGIDAEFLSRDEIARWIPNLDCSPHARFPIIGGLLQPRGGTVRHDAVAWGYARAADALGVDIIQQCEVTGIRIDGGAVTGVETTRGFIATPKIGLAVAGHSSARRGDGRHQAADRNARAAGDGVGAGQAGARHRRHLRRRALLHQPVGQGRARDGRRPRLLQLVRAARQPADHRARRRRVPRAVPELRPPEADAHVGRHHGHDDGRQPDHRQAAGAGPLHDRRLVLRRLQGDAGVGLVLAHTIAHDAAARAQRRVHARALRAGPHDRREGRGPVRVGSTDDPPCC